MLPKAGNLLTAVGAIAGGPVGAAVGAVANAVLQKPLGQATAKNYRVTGPWKDPKVEVVERTVAEFGTVDILIANAGLQQDAPVASMTLDQWNRVLAVNLTGQFLCARAAIREFRRRGVVESVSRAAGKIVCISSVHQVIPWAGHVNYAASKGGVHLMMLSLAQEVAPERIRVNAIAPGAIRTPINRAAWETRAALERLTALIPYGRIGEPEDVARAAVWLASDQSDYVVGTTLFVDGGMTLYPGFAGNG